MRMAVLFAALILIAVVAVVVFSGNTRPDFKTEGKVARASAASRSRSLRVPARVAQALIRRGYPVRPQCGEVADPPPPTRSHSVIALGSLPACWIVIESNGYSVSVTPRTSSAAAKIAYKSVYNRWAKTVRVAAIRNLLVYAFRLPEDHWHVIRQAVNDATTSHR
jgi:hypothetical protein